MATTSHKTLTGTVNYVYHLKRDYPGKKRSFQEAFSNAPKRVWAGWILESSSDNTKYFLSVPNNLYSLLNLARRQNTSVRIHAYRKINVASIQDPYVWIDDREESSLETIWATQPENHCWSAQQQTPSHSLTTLIEVLPNGLVLTAASDNQLNQAKGAQSLLSTPSKRRHLSLAQLKRLQRMGEPISKWHCIRAQVSAITPTLDFSQHNKDSGKVKRDNFVSLLELHQREHVGSTVIDHECVVVLRHSFLKSAQPPLVGQTIELRGSLLQEWKVPQVLKKFNKQDQAPKTVFVVEQNDQIVVVDDRPIISCDAENVSSCSITGEIERVHWVTNDKQEEMAFEPTHKFVHYLEIKEFNQSKNDNNPQSTILYLTYFPMDTCLQWSLRAGAKIFATNIHILEQRVYTACIRSSVELIEPSPNTSLSVPVVEPIRYTRRVNQHYYSLNACRKIEEWLVELNRDNECLLASVQSIIFPVPAPKEISQKKRQLRNAYVEFFHGKSLEIDSSSDLENYYDCEMERGYSSKQCTLLPDDVSCPQPQLTTPSKLHSCSKIELEERLVGHLSQCCPSKGARVGASREYLFNYPEIGWSASFVLSPDDLAKRKKSNQKIWIGGNLSLDSPGSSNFSVLDSRTSMPVVGSALHDIQFHPESNRSFVLGSVSALVVSLVCISCPEKIVSQGKEDICISDLPNFLGENRDFESQSGPLLWVRTAGGFRFIASIFLVVDDIFYRNIGTLNMERPMRVEKVKALSLEQAVTQQTCSDSSFSHFEGLLLRRFVRPKFRKGCFTGLTISLSQVPTLSCISESLIQSVDVKSKFTPDRETFVSWKGILRRIDPQHTLKEEQAAMSYSCFCLGISPKSCPLLCCGFDDALPCDSPQVRLLAIRVSVPIRARQEDEERGYIRFECLLDSLRANVTSLEDRFFFSKYSEQRLFHFVGGHDFVTGMLNTRPPRVGSNNLQFCPGELQVRGENSAHNVSPTPVASLGDLMQCICLDICSAGRSMLAPSLVRKINNANLVSVGFCQVLPECRKCFSSLKSCTNRTSGPKDQGVSACYWNLPMKRSEDDTVRGPIGSGHCAGARIGRRIHCSLECPNGHDVQKYGSIKWECSGVLDDGSGQAKVYAERDCAILFLGLGSSEQTRFLEWMEEGAFSREGGLLWSKSLPIESLMKRDLLVAKEEARRRFGANTNENRILENMKPHVRANYLLHRHMRKLNQTPAMFLDYFVRCKPLADNAVKSVQQTDIRLCVPGKTSASSPQHGTAVAASRTSFSYSMPPLKVVLVDAVAPTKFMKEKVC